jgi:hypothetical protein
MDIDVHPTEQSHLLMRDYLAANASCGGLDPGPDPTWYPDPFPDDDDESDDLGDV